MGPQHLIPQELELGIWGMWTGWETLHRKFLKQDPEIEIQICGALRDLVPWAQFKNREKHPRRSVLLVKLQAKAYNFTKSNTPPWVFFTFFKLYEWYQIVQSTNIYWN